MERALSGRSSMSDHSAEVAGRGEPTSSDLGDTDGVSGGYRTWNSGHRVEKGAAAMKKWEQVCPE